MLKIIFWTIVFIASAFLAGIAINFFYSTSAAEENSYSQFYETSVAAWQAPDYKIIERIATITGYSSSPDETWGDPFLTMSEVRVREGIIACPRWIPFGSLIETSWGQYVCEDRLHLKYDSRFDIWFPSKQEALVFGIRIVPVKIYIFY